jgi:cytidyltransferase-like protein
MKNQTVCITGYFYPLNIKHIEYIKYAKNLIHKNGKLIIIVKNDHQANLTNNNLLPCKDRIKLLKSLKYVDEVIESIDNDKNICKTLEMIKPDYFCNDGDIFNYNINEERICQKLNIQLINSLNVTITSHSARFKKTPWSTNLQENIFYL